MTADYPLSRASEDDLTVTAQMVMEDARALSEPGVNLGRALGDLIGGLSPEQTDAIIKEAISVGQTIAGTPEAEQSPSQIEQHVGEVTQGYLYGFMTAARAISIVQHRESLRDRSDVIGHFVGVNPAQETFGRLICREDDDAICRVNLQHEDTDCLLTTQIHPDEVLSQVRVLGPQSKDELEVEIHQCESGDFGWWVSAHERG